MGKKIEGLSHEALQDIIIFSFPGNIRELEHVIERSVILCNSRLISKLNLTETSKQGISNSPAKFSIKTWQEQERDYILEVFRVTKSKVSGNGGAAELLQLPATKLKTKMIKLGIKWKQFIED